MSTLSSHASISTSPALRITLATCEMCQGPVDPGKTICPGCIRSQAANDAFRLMADVRSLVLGDGHFSVLSKEERQENLDELFRGIAPAPRAVDATPPPVIIRASVKALSNSQLINLCGTSTDKRILSAATGELSRRLADPTIEPDAFYVSPADAAPTPAERDEIESCEPAGFDVEQPPEIWDGMA